MIAHLTHVLTQVTQMAKQKKPTDHPVKPTGCRTAPDLAVVSPRAIGSNRPWTVFVWGMPPDHNSLEADRLMILWMMIDACGSMIDDWWRMADDWQFITKDEGWRMSHYGDDESLRWRRWRWTYTMSKHTVLQITHRLKRLPVRSCGFKKKTFDSSWHQLWASLGYDLLALSPQGTKLGCGEGGCGACTVTVAQFEENRVVHRAVEVSMFGGRFWNKHVRTQLELKSIRVVRVKTCKNNRSRGRMWMA